jgi:hypothetical protein
MAFLMPACVFLAPGLYGQDFSQPIVYSVPGMDKVEVRPDIIYKRDGQDEMKMDIYIAPGLAKDARRPAVLFIHGGPLGQHPSPGAKDWGVYRSYGRLMAASGLVGVTFDHRYVSKKEEDGNGKLNSQGNGKQKSYGYGKQKSHRHGKWNSH